MRVVGVRTLKEFCDRHADIKSHVETWLAIVSKQQWRTSQDILNRFNYASFLSDNRVVFNLKGNDYRLLVKVAYKNQVMKVIKIGTHAEYSKWKL